MSLSNVDTRIVIIVFRNYYFPLWVAGMNGAFGLSSPDGRKKKKKEKISGNDFTFRLVEL